jgi:uncharacterized protein YycO
VKITDTKQHLHQNEQIEQSVLERAKTGDWLVIRGYHATDNLVTAATAIPISHVAVFNAENRMVIEAEGQGIHESTLKEFVNKSYRLLIIRPRWRNDSNSVEAFHNAQRLVGKKYDFLGTVGMNSAEKYYCSELAVDIYKKWHSKNEKFPTIIKPAELYLYGKILYDSLPRDEMKDGDG